MRSIIATSSAGARVSLGIGEPWMIPQLGTHEHDHREDESGARAVEVGYVDLWSRASR